MTDADARASSSTSSEGADSPGTSRYLILAVTVALLFFAGYGFLVSRQRGGADTRTVVNEVRAVSNGAVQRISVDVSKGYFDPAVIRAKAGVPLTVSFGSGSGCMSRVVFKEFDVDRDLTAGGAVIELPALEAGEYPFSCGMEMVFGTLVVD